MDQEDLKCEVLRAQTGARGPVRKEGITSRVGSPPFGDGYFVEWVDHDKGRFLRRYVSELEEANQLRADLPEGPDPDDDWQVLPDDDDDLSDQVDP